MAPEIMEDLPYNEKVDVYSYGIVLCELLSRQHPFADTYHPTCYQVRVLLCLLVFVDILTIVSFSFISESGWCV